MFGFGSADIGEEGLKYSGIVQLCCRCFLASEQFFFACVIYLALFFSLVERQGVGGIGVLARRHKVRSADAIWFERSGIRGENNLSTQQGWILGGLCRFNVDAFNFLMRSVGSLGANSLGEYMIDVGVWVELWWIISY